VDSEDVSFGIAVTIAGAVVGASGIVASIVGGDRVIRDRCLGGIGAWDWERGGTVRSWSVGCLEYEVTMAKSRRGR
jgi:hypothetical protein